MSPICIHKDHHLPPLMCAPGDKARFLQTEFIIWPEWMLRTVGLLQENMKTALET